MAIETVNPATGERLASFPPLSPTQLEAKVARAAAAFRTWRTTPVAERCAAVGRAGDVLAAEKDRLARLATLEMGKPLASAVAEVEKCAWVCRFYAENAAAMLAPQPVETEASWSLVRHDPLGPLLAVMPWNFPYWQVFRFAAPALAAGNVGLLKHASNVPQCALAIEEVFRRAGLPEGCFTTLLVEADAVAGLIADPRVAAVTLTGSEGAGVAVGRAAGAALKKVVLELGGSDPFLVMPSAELGKAIETAVTARTLNNGQSCIAAKRFLIHEEVANAFELGFVARMATLRVGDPFDPSTEIGPLATPAIAAQLEEQVAQSVAAGARLLLGGRRVPGAGNYFEPTVLTDPPLGSPAWGEELFGPVATLFRVASLDQAITLANATRFGLGASAWTRDPAEQERLATELEAGSVFFNSMVKSDPRLPFGGIKHSGHGRELGAWGLREFVNLKTVWVG
ncbi:MAG TPA: NAD-dependent succinate-semialdehyde dehydrogenase [Thermoanaerobaculia bacterium]|nr:NAD-dependent succinate-semialdehyde dehydrogenase [Thermoanaerobaculia bacterium]